MTSWIVQVAIQAAMMIYAFAVLKTEVRGLKDETKALREAMKLSAGKDQIATLITAVDKLERVVNTLIEYKFSVERRLVSIEAKCSLYHNDRSFVDRGNEHDRQA